MPTGANILRLVICLGLCYGAAMLGSMFTVPNLQWYQTLAKPALHPPQWVFAPVWTVLYTLMAIAAFLVWRQVIPPARVRLALGAFVFQLLFNVLWSLTFFGARSLVGGLVIVILLFFSIVATILAFARVSKPAAGLLLPYLLWVGFAAYLNATIVPLNH